MSDSSESDRTSTTLSLYVDENDNRLAAPSIVTSQSRVEWLDLDVSDDGDGIDDDLKMDEKMLGDGSEEDDSLLVIYNVDPPPATRLY